MAHFAGAWLRAAVSPLRTGWALQRRHCQQGAIAGARSRPRRFTAAVYWGIDQVSTLLGFAWNVAILYLLVGFRHFSHAFGRSGNARQVTSSLRTSTCSVSSDRRCNAGELNVIARLARCLPVCSALFGFCRTEPSRPCSTGGHLLPSSGVARRRADGHSGGPPRPSDRADAALARLFPCA